MLIGEQDKISKTKINLKIHSVHLKLTTELETTMLIDQVLAL